MLHCETSGPLDSQSIIVQRLIEKRWTRFEVTVLIGAAISAAVLSAVIQEFGVWQKTSSELVRLKNLAQWNLQVLKERSESDRQDSERTYATFCKEHKQYLKAAMVKVAQNRILGVKPWSGLSQVEEELLFGPAPIAFYIGRKRDVRVYFDQDRNGIIMNPASTRLADVSTDLQSIAKKFHLKQSQYVPGIYGLDPASGKAQIWDSIDPNRLGMEFWGKRN